MANLKKKRESLAATAHSRQESSVAPPASARETKEKGAVRERDPAPRGRRGSVGAGGRSDRAEPPLPAAAAAAGLPPYAQELVIEALNERLARNPDAELPEGFERVAKPGTGPRPRGGSGGGGAAAAGLAAARGAAARAVAVLDEDGAGAEPGSPSQEAVRIVLDGIVDGIAGEAVPGEGEVRPAMGEAGPEDEGGGEETAVVWVARLTAEARGAAGAAKAKKVGRPRPHTREAADAFNVSD